MRERRQYERFDLCLPAEVEVMMPENKVTFNFTSNDVSAGGAYFHAAELIPKDSRVRVNLSVQSKKVRELTGSQGLIQVEGTVVRSGPGGIAVCFGGDCRIVSLTELQTQSKESHA